MTEAIPDPPEGWTVSTATPTHISLYYAAGDGQSLMVRPTDPPDTEKWTVKGLAESGPPYPVFADGVARAVALDTAIEVMDAVVDDESVEPLRTETTADGDSGVDTGDTGDTDDAGDDSDAATDSQAESEETVDQADLTAFAGDDTE